MKTRMPVAQIPRNGHDCGGCGQRLLATHQVVLTAAGSVAHATCAGDFLIVAERGTWGDLRAAWQVAERGRLAERVS